MASLSTINKRKTLPYAFLKNADINYAKLNSNFRYLEDTIRSIANDPLLADRIVKLLNIGKGWKPPVSTFADLSNLTGNEDGDVRLVKTGNGQGLYRYDQTTNSWIALSQRFWKFPVNTKLDLPGVAAIPPNENGDVRLVLNENRLYKWNSISDIWEGLFSANLTSAVDTVAQLKAIPSGGLSIDEMKLVRQTHDLWRWDGTQWINLTPETIINFLENSDLSFATVALTGSSSANRQTVDSWYIKTGNPSHQNQVTDSEETADLTKIKFGDQSLKIVTANLGGPINNISPSNPVRVYQRFTGNKALQFKENFLTFSIWIHCSNNSIKPYIILSTDGTNTEEIIGPSIQNTLVYDKTVPLTADIAAMATNIGTPFDNNAYIEIGVRIENQGTYYLDGSIVGQGEIYSLEYTPNFSLEELVEARQLKTSLIEVLGYLTDLQTPIQSNFVAAINSIIVYDVTVDNATDFISAVNDSNVKSIFIKNGTYNIAQDLEIGSKYIIGESRNGVIINFSNGFGFTIYGDTSINEGGTIEINPAVNAKKVNGVGTSFSNTDVGKYIFIGKDDKLKVPYKIAAYNSATDIDLEIDYSGPEIDTADASEYFITGLKEDTKLYNFTIIGSKGFTPTIPEVIPALSTYDDDSAILDIKGSINTYIINILIKDNNNNLNTNTAFRNNYSYETVCNELELKCSRIGFLSHRTYNCKYLNLEIGYIRDSTLPSAAFWINRCVANYFYNININGVSSAALAIGHFISASYHTILDKIIIINLYGSNFTIQNSENIHVINSIYKANYYIGAIPIDNISVPSGNKDIYINNNYFKSVNLPSSPRNFISLVSENIYFENNLIEVFDVTTNDNNGIISLLGPSFPYINIYKNTIKIINSQVGAVIYGIWSVGDSKNTINENIITHSGSATNVNGIVSEIEGDLITNNQIQVPNYGIFSKTGNKKLISNNILASCLVGIKVGDSFTISEEDTLIGNKFYSCTENVNVQNTVIICYLWNDPEIAQFQLLYNNKEWTARNKIINYPFTDASDLDNGSIIIRKDWIFGLYLFGCKYDKQYYISRINNNGTGGLYEIEITEDGTGIVAAFSDNAPPAFGYTNITPRNGSLIYGFLLSDFAEMLSDSGTFDESFALSNTELLKDLCYTVGLKQWEDYNKLRKYPFIDSATYTFSDGVFSELLLFETLLSESYYVKSILKDLTNNIYTIEIARTDGTVVSKFDDITIPSGATFFTPEPGHTVKGFANIDWSLIPDTLVASGYVLADTNILKKNLIITSSSTDEWETENQVRKYPFTIGSSMTNGTQAVGNGWFWSAKIYGCELSVVYYVSRIKTSVGQYIIEISDESGLLVSSWTGVTIPSNDYIELEEENLSGITGYMLLDFSAMPVTMDENYLLGDLDLIPDVCILSISDLFLFDSLVPSLIDIASNYTVDPALDNRKLIAVDSSGGSVTIKMPLSGIPDKFLMHIKDISGNASVNAITIDGNGTNIEGQSTIQINSDYGNISIMYYPTTDEYILI